ncbi:Hypothetical protein, putative [Bodo saltans]|uniref:Uncharacterized protein n=1 Tax=Bodo saltans TaxID=75058 RepID=A0A0S4JQM5_BODSA|nr:Hypothetical protein, putative [Bodo saltans]|eukprot:CUG90821.1 Hypothetical protein, putative [Bodo saltans]
MLRLCVLRLAANKKFLKLTCKECTRLLPVAHFNHAATVLHGVDRLVCLSCKKYCVHCGQLQPKSQFPDYTEAQVMDNNPSSSSSSSHNSGEAVSLDIYGQPIMHQQPQRSSSISPSGSNKRTNNLPSTSSTLDLQDDDDEARSHHNDWCTSCIGKRHAADTNVYFRFPVLKYRSCPFSVDRYREVIAEERTQQQPQKR